jgi:hypothetical protein
MKFHAQPVDNSDERSTRSRSAGGVGGRVGVNFRLVVPGEAAGLVAANDWAPPSPGPAARAAPVRCASQDAGRAGVLAWVRVTC